MVNKTRIYWTLQAGGWLLFALLEIGWSIDAQGAQPKNILFFLCEALIGLIVSHLLRNVLIRYRWLDLPMRKLLPRVFGCVILSGFVIYFLRVPVSLIVGKSFEANEVFGASQILSFSTFYAFLLFIWSVFYLTYHYVEQYNKSLKFEALVAAIELRNLKNQLNPHFIFNALNSIRALIDEEPYKAKMAINQLSNILRNSLNFDKKELTKFEDELKMVRDYLGLESIRFEERLKTELSIHPSSNAFLVPPFMIQTLVENGIKHGISKRTDGGLIQIKTEVEDDRMIVSIRNSGQYVNGSKRSNGKEGVGLKNTIQRLRLLYGEKASLRITNEKNNFVLTEVVIPQTK